MQEIIGSKIVHEEVFYCPICGYPHPTEEAAEECADMGLWNQNFDVDAPLWRWNIFKPHRFSQHIVAIIPKRVNAEYTWSHSRCDSRAVSLFNSDSNDYWNITKNTKVISVSLMEGFDRYHLVPPVQHIGVLPIGKVDEVTAVLKKALDFRQGELLGGGMCIAKDLLAISAFEFCEFTTRIRLSGGGELAPMVDMAFLPQTHLVSGKMLYELEKHIPEIVAELE